MARGISVETAIPEDFGWSVQLHKKPFKLWIGCGNIDGLTNQWTLFTVVELSLMQRLFKLVDPTLEIERLRVHLAEIVLSIPRVTNIVWES